MMHASDGDSLIHAAFSKAQTAIDGDLFLAEIEQLETRRRRTRRIAITVAAAAGGSLATLFAPQAAAMAMRKLPLGFDTTGSLLTVLCLLLVAGLVADSLTA